MVQNSEHTTMELLAHTTQELSRARTIEDIMHIVRTSARKLNGADGATFVLRDGTCVFMLMRMQSSRYGKGVGSR